MTESDHKGQPEGREECLEALFRLERAGTIATVEQLRRNPDLGGLDVSACLIDLLDNDLIDPNIGTIRLTAAGRAIGRRIYARHELMERVLRLLGMRRSRAHEEACRLEHVIKVPQESSFVRDAELDRIVRLLSLGALPLSRARANGCYRVGLIRAGHGAKRRLEDLGVTENAKIRLKNFQPQGPVEIEVRGSSLALGRGIAAKVMVVPADGEPTR